jgi:hypothetical protein
VSDDYIDPLAVHTAAAVAERERVEREAGNGVDPSPKTDRRRFRPVRFKDVILNVSRPYLVERILPREGLIVIWGPPKCGKTFWTLDLAMHVALRRKYRGRRVHQGTVVYIASEGERGLSARVHAFKARHLGKDEQDPPFYLLTTRLNLVKDVETLIQDIRVALGEQQCVLIVIDTLNRTIAGGESNDADMTAYIDAADQLRRAFTSTVAIIHHCAVQGSRPRGHSSLDGAADAQISAKKDAAGHVLTTVEFMKDGLEGETTLSRLVSVEVGVDEDNQPITSLIVEPVEPSEPQSVREKTPKLANKQQIALDTLRKAIAAAGEPAPTHNHIPANVRVIPVDLWRRFYLHGTSTDDQPDNTRRKAWREACEALKVKKIIGLCDEMVWEI